MDIHNLRDDVFLRDTVEIDGREMVLFSAIVKGKSLKRKIKVVIAELRCGGIRNLSPLPLQIPD